MIRAMTEAISHSRELFAQVKVCLFATSLDSCSGTIRTLDGVRATATVIRPVLKIKGIAAAHAGLPVNCRETTF